MRLLSLRPRGRATSRADVNAPVGCDTHGYAYRSGGGEKVHNAVREAYGAAFGEGDVVGVYLSLGATSQRKARGVCCRVCSHRLKWPVRQEVVRPAGQPPGQLFTVERERRRAGSSAVAFAVNSVAQSIAYTTVAGGATRRRCGLRLPAASADVSVQTSSFLLPACSRSRRKRSPPRCSLTSGLSSSSRRLISALASQLRRLFRSWHSQRRSETRFFASGAERHAAAGMLCTLETETMRHATHACT